MPGFIDAHCHPSGVQELYGVNTNLRTVREIQAAIKQKAETTPPGVWVTGFMFDDTKLDRPLTRKDLDEATTEHPVSVAHRGGHTNFYNSKAFELAGITEQTPDPPDGRFFRENGELNGRVAENARGVFNRVGKRETFTAGAAARSGAQGHGAHVEAVQRRGPHLGAQRRRRRRIRSSPTRTAARTAS